MVNLALVHRPIASGVTTSSVPVVKIWRGALPGSLPTLAGPTCSCKKQINFLTALLLGGHRGPQHPSYATCTGFLNNFCQPLVSTIEINVFLLEIGRMKSIYKPDARQLHYYLAICVQQPCLHSLGHDMQTRWTHRPILWRKEGRKHNLVGS